MTRALRFTEAAEVRHDHPMPPTARPDRVSGLIFDFDGLLADTETSWSRAEASVFADYGWGFGPAEKAVCLGRTIPDAAAAIARHVGRPAESRAIEAALWERATVELATSAPPKPGAVELLAWTQARFPFAVASNTARELLNLAMRSAGLADLIERSVAGDEVPAPKPAPDVYLAACARFAIDPATAVAFEDSPAGARAARDAGLFLIGIPSEPGVVLEADWVVPTLEDPSLLAWLASVENRGPAGTTLPRPGRR